MSTKKEENKIGIALVNYVCPICGKINEKASSILMNQELDVKIAQEVEKLHNQIIGYSNPCEDCQKVIDEGGFWLIGIDIEKTTDKNNPYRTGHLVAVKKDSDFYKSLPESFHEKSAAFIDQKDMIKLGLIDESERRN